MKILVACEESQAVTIELRRQAHEAFSCDILACSGGHEEWHIQDDIMKALYYDDWQAIIAFPPCTDLAVSGARHFKKKRENGSQQDAIKFFMKFVDWHEGTRRPLAIENPVGVMYEISQARSDYKALGVWT